MNKAVLIKTLTVLGVEFDAQSEFTYDLNNWEESHGNNFAPPENHCEVTGICPESFIPVNNLTDAILHDIGDAVRAWPINMAAYYVANKKEAIEKKLENVDPLTLADEDEFVEAAE